MTIETPAPSPSEAIKALNWSKISSFILGAFAPVLISYLNILEGILNSHPLVRPLAAVVPLLSGWIAARGTSKGSLAIKRKSKADVEDFETGDDEV